MSNINLREAINAISEVIINRPRPLREFDQIYMRAGDMLLQTEHVSHLFEDKNIAFIGDGDSISLCLMYLHKVGILKTGPSHIHVLDFDERIVNSIKHFAKKFGIEDKITSELYNVAEPLPITHWQQFDGFYTNPPYGASNGGSSVEAFLLRGIECCGKDAVASIVIADDPKIQWTQTILFKMQEFMIKNSFLVSELIPTFHTYHLDDEPGLKSCALSFKRHTAILKKKYSSSELDNKKLKQFYGDNNPLAVKFVKDLTQGGKIASKDYKMIKYE